MTIRFNALVPGDDHAAVTAAMARVVSSGWFVLGPEVEGFEASSRRRAEVRTPLASEPAPTRSR